MSKNEPAKTTAEGGALGDAYDKVSERVNSAYSSASTGLEANPFAALLGGLALGAIAGALIPRAAREQELLQPLGARLGDAARAALGAGRTAGTQAFTDAGFGAENVRAQLSKLIEQALGAAGSAGTAALSAARDAAQG